MLDHLNALSRSLPPLWEMSVTAAYAAAVVIVLRLLLKRRAPRQIVCLLWLVVFARLLIPVTLESPLSIVPDALPGQEQVQPSGQGPSTPHTGTDAPANTQAPAQQVGAGQTGAVGEPAAGQPTAPAPSLTVPDGVAPTLPQQPAQAGFPWQALLAGAWLAGALSMGGYALISYLRLRRRLFDAIRARDGAWEHPDLDSPFILGILRPRIYLPAGLVGRPRKFILCHERAHLRRLDHIVKPVCWAALALHWFNPMVWVAFILMSRDIEAACDEAVLRRLGDEVKADYSTTLLALATGGRVPAPCPLAFDEGDAKGRIKNVLKYQRPALWVIVVSVIAAALAAVCLLTDPVAAKAPADGPGAPDDPPAPVEDLNGLLDPWMLEVLNGERQFISAYSQYAEGNGRTYGIHDLRTFYYGDDQYPDERVELGKLAIIDLDRDGINEMVIWPMGDHEYLYSSIGYLILRRQGDEVYGYNPVYRAFGLLKSDGTFDWSNSAFNWGIASAQFTENGFEGHDITWCELHSEYDERYFVDGQKATREGYEAAIAAHQAKPGPVWYVYEGGQLKYAPIRVPIPLDAAAQAAPVPQFLNEEQQLLYRQAYTMYDHIFGPNTEAVDDWPGGGGYNGGDAVESNGWGYVPATGRYANWADFQEAVLSVFTPSYWQSRNYILDSGTTPEGAALYDPLYTNIGGQLHYVSTSRGNTGNNTYFPETFRLVERTEDTITFVTTAYYTENPGGEPAEGWDAYLRSHCDYVQEFPIRMVRTQGGWRFDQFFCPATDFHCARLAAYGPTPIRPASLDGHAPGPLTQEELDYFDRYFNMGLQALPTIRSMLLVPEYDSPADIDLYTLFYHGVTLSPAITQAEYDALGWNAYGQKFKVTAAEMDQMLLRYIGLGLEQTNGVGLDSFRYLADTNAYYASHNDTLAQQASMVSGQYGEDGSISLTYHFSELPAQTRTVTLRAADELDYHILSNVRAQPLDGLLGQSSGPEPVSLRLDGSQLVLTWQDSIRRLDDPITAGNFSGLYCQDFDGDGQTEVVLVYDRDGFPQFSLYERSGGQIVRADTFDSKQMLLRFNRNSVAGHNEDSNGLTVTYARMDGNYATSRAVLPDGFFNGYEHLRGTGTYSAYAARFSQFLPDGALFRFSFDFALADATMAQLPELETFYDRDFSAHYMAGRRVGSTGFLLSYDGQGFQVREGDLTMDYPDDGDRVAPGILTQLDYSLTDGQHIPDDPSQWYLVAQLPDDMIWLFTRSYGSETLLQWDGNFFQGFRYTAHTSRGIMPDLKKLGSDPGRYGPLAVISNVGNGTGVSLFQLVVYDLDASPAAVDYQHDWSELMADFNNGRTFRYDDTAHTLTCSYRGQEITAALEGDSSLYDRIRREGLSVLVTGNNVAYWFDRTRDGDIKLELTIEAFVGDDLVPIAVPGYVTWTIRFNGSGFDTVPGSCQLRYPTSSS